MRETPEYRICPAPSCNRTFPPAQPHQIYCCRQCSKKAKNARARPPKPVVYKTCAADDCDNSFVVKGPRHIYCSSQCSQRMFQRGYCPKKKDRSGYNNAFAGHDLTRREYRKMRAEIADKVADMRADSVPWAEIRVKLGLNEKQIESIRYTLRSRDSYVDDDEDTLATDVSWLDQPSARQRLAMERDGVPVSLYNVRWM